MIIFFFDAKEWSFGSVRLAIPQEESRRLKSAENRFLAGVSRCHLRNGRVIDPAGTRRLRCAKEAPIFCLTGHRSIAGPVSFGWASSGYWCSDPGAVY